MQEEAFAIPTAVAKTYFHHNFARKFAGSVSVFHKLFVRMAFSGARNAENTIFTSAYMIKDFNSPYGNLLDKIN